MKKKGFTLVELLAVIVVLAIIALIAVPVVINITKSAQRGAFKSSAYGILESAKIYYLSGKVQSKDVLSRIDVVQKDENDKYILEYNGEKPESGVIVFNSNGKSALAIKKGTFCASKNYNEEEIKVQDIDKNGKNAITHFKVLKRYQGYTLLEINIETGRTHQIRVHLSNIGYPIVGDMVYSNGKNEFNVQGQMLHAKSIEFVHPITLKKMKVEAPLPTYFNEVLEELKNRELDI